MIELYKNSDECPLWQSFGPYEGDSFCPCADREWLEIVANALKEEIEFANKKIAGCKNKMEIVKEKLNELESRT